MNKQLKEKMARKMTFKKDEEKGIEEYKGAIKKSEGKEKNIYKEILQEEEKHLNKINKIKL